MIELFQNTPVATIIFAFTLLTSGYALFVDGNVSYALSLHPYSINRRSRYYTILTSGFVHADLAHLAFNMFTFFFFAFQLEQIFVLNKGPVGHWYFLAVYIVGLILSDVSTIMKHKDNPNYYSLGASGAISAVLFSFILFYPQAKINLMFIPIGIPAFIFGPIYLAYCAYAAKNQRDHINHDAHFYGALAGLLFTIIAFPGILPRFIQVLTTS